MINQEVALRYSKSLMVLADSKEDRVQQLSLLERVVDSLEKTPDIRQFLSSPQVELKQKEEVFKHTFSDYLKEESQLMSFLLLLLEKHRLAYLPEIVKEYRQLVNQYLNTVEVKFITTVPLDATTKQKLITKLEKAYKKKIDLKEEINPKLIGGGILITGDHMQDFSIKGKLANLKEDLLLTKV